MEPLPCSTIVYRAIRPSWVDVAAQTILPIAFKRRPTPADEVGISVDVLSAQSCARALKKCQVASLHVGRVRNAGLDIIVDDAPHANITGIPRETDDQATANRFAHELARQARLIPPISYRGAES